MYSGYADLCNKPEKITYKQIAVKRIINLEYLVFLLKLPIPARITIIKIP